MNSLFTVNEIVVSLHCAVQTKKDVVSDLPFQTELILITAKLLGVQHD